jgi:hypothetical protein
MNVRYINPITGKDRPPALQESEASRFHDKWHTKEVRLLDLRAGRLYLQEDTSGTHFC